MSTVLEQTTVDRIRRGIARCGERACERLQEAVEAIAPGAHPGRIYFVRTLEGPPRLKVGYSTRVDRRVVELQTGSAVELSLIASLPAPRADEAALHRALARHRVREGSEWYELHAIGIVVGLIQAGRIG